MSNKSFLSCRIFKNKDAIYWEFIGQDFGNLYKLLAAGHFGH
jgi:hypothetical protein